MMNLEWLGFVRLTGNDFLDVVLLQLAAVVVAFGYAEYLTRRDGGVA